MPFPTIKPYVTTLRTKIDGQVITSQEARISAMATLTMRRTLASLLSRVLSQPSSSSISSSSRFSLALINHIPQLDSGTTQIPVRYKTTGPGYSPLNDSSPNWSNRPPRQTILLDGCDYEHWLIVMEFTSDPKPSEEEMINSYVKTLASVTGRYFTQYFLFIC